VRTNLRAAFVAIGMAVAIACGHNYAEDDTPLVVEAGVDAANGVDAAHDVDSNVAMDAGQDASPEASTRFCANVGMQLNTSIFCADFDGTKIDEGFTRVSDAGFSATTVTAVSAPNALLATGPGGSSFFPPRGPALTWENLGNPISVLDVTVSINQPAPQGPPPAGETGSITLVKMETEQTHTSFVFSRAMASWTLSVEYDGSAAFGSNTPIPIAPPEGKWTRVNLVYNIRTGNVTVAYDGLTVLTKAGYMAQATLVDSKATISVGAQAAGMTFAEPFRFDNLVARVTRE
jgi:hypothetical protein